MSPAFGAEAEWQATRSLHFTIHHEATWLPRGFQASSEAAFRKVSHELASLGTWLLTDKIDVFLYHGRDSYLAGRFHPPAWSDGLAFPKGASGEAAIVLYEGGNPSVFAHELSHYVLGNYFAQAGRRPPRWLDEGLAMLIQGENPGKLAEYIPLKSFFGSAPASDSSSDWVGGWYAQALSMTTFLIRSRTPFQFARLCAGLRDGGDLERTLFAVYSYPSLAAFEKAWLAWVQSPTPAKD